MTFRKIILTIPVLSFVFPSIVFAQSGVQVLQGYQLLIKEIGQIIGDLIPILITIAIVVFFIGLVQFVQKTDTKAGVAKMQAGIISLFIMVSLWGIITVMQQVLNINKEATQSAPLLGGGLNGNNNNNGNGGWTGVGPQP